MRILWAHCIILVPVGSVVKFMRLVDKPIRVISLHSFIQYGIDTEDVVGANGDDDAEEVNSVVCVQLLKLNQTTITMSLLVSAGVHHFFKQIFSDTIVNQTVNNRAQSNRLIGLSGDSR